MTIIAIYEVIEMKKVYKTISMPRKQIYEEVWNAPLTVLAKKYSLNYAELPKALKKSNIPYPGSGFWQKKKWGKITEADIAPLPESNKENVDLPLPEFEMIETEFPAGQKWLDDILKDIERIKNKGVKVYAMHLSGSEFYEKDFTKGTAFLIGNEGNGLSPEVSAAADEMMRIPMMGKVESLNAAISASVVSYEALRQRRGK